MRTIFTAIFGNYEALKEPTVITPGWNYICYTDQPFVSNVWEIRKVRTTGNNLQLLAREYKVLFNDHADTFESIWIDGSFIINTDLNVWWEKHFKPEITCISHPIRQCVFEEAAICIKNRRGDPNRIARHAEAYRNIIPSHNGLIQSGILMRQKTDLVTELCQEWYKEILEYSLRDQISFAMIAMKYPINYIHWDYRCSPEFTFKAHFKKQ